MEHLGYVDLFAIWTGNMGDQPVVLRGAVLFVVNDREVLAGETFHVVARIFDRGGSRYQL